MATEDFTTYTEVDEDSDITVTATKCDVSTMRRDALSYVRKDKGASHFGDFEHLITGYIGTGGSGLHANANFWGLSNGSNTYNQMATNNEGMCLAYYYWSDYRCYLEDLTTDNYDGMGSISAPVAYYFTIERNGTTLTAKIYSDAARTNLVDTLTITCGTLAYRYIFGITSIEQNGYAASTLSLYSENLDLMEGWRHTLSGVLMTSGCEMDGVNQANIAEINGVAA